MKGDKFGQEIFLYYSDNIVQSLCFCGGAARPFYLECR